MSTETVDVKGASKIFQDYLISCEVPNSFSYCILDSSDISLEFVVLLSKKIFRLTQYRVSPCQGLLVHTQNSHLPGVFSSS